MMPKEIRFINPDALKGCVDKHVGLMKGSDGCAHDVSIHMLLYRIEQLEEALEDVRILAGKLPRHGDVVPQIRRIDKITNKELKRKDRDARLQGSKDVQEGGT